jgi:hypothetical protein
MVWSAPNPWRGEAFAGAEAPGFRDFPGLQATKENRSVSRQTLPIVAMWVRTSGRVVRMRLALAGWAHTACHSTSPAW